VLGRALTVSRAAPAGASLFVYEQAKSPLSPPKKRLPPKKRPQPRPLARKEGSDPSCLDQSQATGTGRADPIGGDATVVVGNNFWITWVSPSTSLGFMPIPVACGHAKPCAARMLLHENEMRIS
jgi:hypothetical protein